MHESYLDDNAVALSLCVSPFRLNVPVLKVLVTLSFLPLVASLALFIGTPL